jgi:AGZA family xanthine/uracil permease-like MFS transporter
MLACFLGSPFPTTIYIGHPGWKAMGARHGYSILNGVIISLLCLSGGVSFFLHYVPRECIFGILLWIAIIITAQAFMEIPKEHSLAVAFGLIPAFAAYCYYLIEHALKVGGVTINMDMANKLTNDNFFIRGILRLDHGSLLVSMIFAAIMVFLIERKFDKAAYWTFAASFFSFTGLIHTYVLTDTGVLDGFGSSWAPSFGLMYLLVGGIFLFLHYRQKSTIKPSRKKKKEKKPEFVQPPISKVGYV